MARPKKRGDAKAWAKSYFGNSTFDWRETDAALEKAGIFPRRVKTGLPSYFVVPQFGIDSGTITWINYDRCMASAKCAYEEGYGLALTDTFLQHLRFLPERALPRWMSAALDQGLSLWRECRATSIDAALGVKLPRSKIPSVKMRADFAGMIFIAIGKARQADVPLDVALYEAIAERFGVSARTIQHIYEEMGKNVKLQQ